jgi:hypothetical protein
MAHFSRVKATTLRAKQAGSIPAPDTTYNTQVSQLKILQDEKKDDQRTGAVTAASFGAYGGRGR